MDPRRFRSGRWFLLAEGVLVSAFASAGLVAGALHPHADPTGTPVLGLASTPAHNAILLAFGLLAVAAVGKRRAAVTVTALSAVAYTMLLFFSSVATSQRMPTPLGLHAAHILLHGVLAVVNLALLMWLIPDELGDEAWVPRRGRRRSRDQQQLPASKTATDPSAAPTSQVSATNPESSSRGKGREQEPGVHANPSPSASVRPVLEQSSSQETNENQLAARATTAMRSRGGLMAAAVLAVVVGIVLWRRFR
ncbi:hypothetical protein A9W99_00460 [Mycobacterium sp. 1164966.3]|nr:hypothetical protein A9W99_00460 [Mycobacterium sp. 1164966.3]